MKWYRKDHHRIATIQLGMSIDTVKSLEYHVLQYARLVFKFSRKVNLEEQKIGALNLQDVQQIAFEGLIAAWNRVDWEKIKKSPNSQKTLVNYLASNIEGNIKRRIYQEATGVAIPESYIRKTKAELIADNLFGNWLYGFKLDDYAPGTFIRYSNIIEYNHDSSTHENDHLNDLLTTEMFKCLNDKERQIIRWNYGLDADKLTSKEIGNKLGMHEGSVRKTMQRAISKLNNHDSLIILKDFL